MRIEVKGSRHSLKPVERTSVERQLRLALGRYAARVTSATATVEEAPGPLGGIDKHCRVELRGPGGLHMIVVARGHDCESSAVTAGDRLSRAVARFLTLEQNRVSTNGSHLGTNWPASA